jgi:hypothetical protein
MTKGMTVYDENGEIVGVFYSVIREGDKLVVDGKALGTMRMDMIIPLEEVFHGLRMALSWGAISYILLLPYFSVRNLFRNVLGRPSQK